MKPKVYVETTIVGYLTSDLSQDLVTAGHQKTTQDWWAKYRSQYQLFCSDLVIQEAEAGNEASARKRLDVLRHLKTLVINSDVERLALVLLKKKAFPAKATVDAFHLATAAVHRMSYLLTWNCKHLANASMRSYIERICRQAGLRPPVVCTPEELFEG